MVVTHISILLTAMGGLLASVAATVSAIKGRKVSERSEQTSARNEQALVVIHGMLNGKATEMEAELAAARRELAALRGNDA